MVNVILFLIFVLGFTAVIYLLTRVLRLFAFPLEKRYLNCRYIVWFFILGLVVFNRFTFSYILLLEDKIINSRYLETFWDIVLIHRNYEVLYLILSFLLANLILVLMAIILFAIIRIVSARFRDYVEFKDQDIPFKLCHFPWILTTLFYERKDGAVEYSVNERGFTSGLWAKKMKFAFLILHCAEILFFSYVVLSYRDSLVQISGSIMQGLYMLPVFAYILCDQIACFLEADVEAEVSVFSSSDTEDHLEGNMEALFEVYKETFKPSGALMNAFAMRSGRHIARDGLVNNGLNQKQLDDCLHPEILKIICNDLAIKGVRMSDSYQDALGKIIDGESVNIRDYFEGEFLIYFAAYINFYLSQENSFLILCKDNRHAAAIQASVTESLNKLNELHSIWTVGLADQAESKMDVNVLVLSYHDFNMRSIREKAPEFFEYLSCVVFVDSEMFCAQSNVLIESTFSELAAIGRELQYIIFSESDNDSMRTMFEYHIGRELYPYNNDNVQDDSYVMIWRDDSDRRIQRYLDENIRNIAYLGTEIPLGLMAIRYDMPDVRIFSTEDNAYYSYYDRMKMSSPAVQKYLESRLDVEKALRFNKFSETQNAKLAVMIVRDTHYNIFNAIHAWCKYGGTEATLLHIISPSYMLREYFADKANVLIDQGEDFAIYAHRSSMKHDSFQKILLELYSDGVLEDDIMMRNEEYGWGYADIVPLLEDCLRSVLTEEEFHNIYECFIFNEERIFDETAGEYVVRKKVKLKDTDIKDRIHEKLGYTMVMTQGKNGRVQSIMTSNIYNNYLPDQVAAIGNHAYRILFINKGIVYAQQTIPDEWKEYYQSSEFEIRNVKVADELVDVRNIDYVLYTADAVRNIYGYWESIEDICLQSDDIMQFKSVTRGKTEEPISEEKKSISILELGLKKSAFSGDPEKGGLLAAFVIQQFLKTLFPLNYQNLFVVTVYDADAQYWEKTVKAGELLSMEEKLHSLIPFVREPIFKKTDDVYHIYLIEYTEFEMGLVSGIFSEREKLFRMMDSYLKWYEEEGKGTFLNLGGDGVAGVFDIGALRSFCRSTILSGNEVVDEKLPEIRIRPEHYCSFCGRNVIFAHVMDDGRKMCRSCKQQQLSQRDEIRQMYRQTVQFLCKGYHIEIRKRIHIRFQSAEAIRKVTTSRPDERVLGFYEYKKHELWIESRGPRVAMQDTLIHELTHAWQYDNLDMRKLNKLSEEDRLTLLEGHAVYVEIDAMKELGEVEYAERMEKIALSRQDVYGNGYRKLKDYLDEKKEQGSQYTPFEAMKELVNSI